MRNFEAYLMNVIKEQYEDMMEALHNLNDEELDNLYLDDEGNVITSDKEFLLKHKDKILTEEIYDAVYSFISQICLLEERDITRLIAYLCTHYYIRNYDNKDNQAVLKYLANTDIKNIVELFYSNSDFGIDLVKSFYMNSVNEEKYYETKEQISKDKRDQELNKLFEVAFPERIFTINQKLREVVCNLYDYYIEMGCTDKEALSLTWDYFLMNFDPLHELEDMGFDEAEILFYKNYTIGLIIGDLYEDVSNKPLVNTDNYYGKIAQLLPVLLTNFGEIAIPGDVDVRNRMLKYFILLQNDPAKKKSNREKTHSDGRELQLKKVNPIYILDELTF